jgi:hypothetical protein
MGRIDPRVLRAARLAGAAFFAVGAVDVVLRGHDLSRNEDGAIFLGAGAALLVLHVVLARLGDGRTSDAQLAAALSVPLVPIGVALLAFSPPSGSDFLSGDVLSPFRDAASEGLAVAGVVYAIAYLLTRHPRWMLVVALALGFAAELQSAAPIPIIGMGGDSWTPTLILSGAAAVAAVAAVVWRTAPAEQQNLLVAAAVMLAAASESRAFGPGGADAGRDLFLLAAFAAEVAIAWWRTTPAVAVAVAVSGGLLAASLAQRSGWIGVVFALAGAALAGGATIWAKRSAGGGPAAELPPAPAA